MGKGPFSLNSADCHHLLCSLVHTPPPLLAFQVSILPTYLPCILRKVSQIGAPDPALSNTGASTHMASKIGFQGAGQGDSADTLLLAKLSLLLTAPVAMW